jgi:hypothetical protein
MSQEILERFHRALIEEIQTQRPEYLTGPFTVAEIYQNLVPYGSHRDRIGVEMNADYEDALLRLLAGEGGFLVLESDPALQKIRSELELANPNTAVYREYAAVDVRLNQSRLDLSAAAIDEITDLAEALDADFVPVPLHELAPAESAPDEVGIIPPGVDVFTLRNGPSEVPSTAAMPESADGNGHGSDTAERSQAPAGTDDADGSGADADRDERDVPAGGLQPEYVEPADLEQRGVAVKAGDPCLWCRAELPQREKLNYCPFCGTDLAIVPCPSCGEEVEPGWRFCAACGTEVD